MGSNRFLFSSTLKKRLKDIIAISVGGAITFCGIGIYTNNENFYQSFIMRGFHKLDPETAHKFSINLARYNLVPSEKLHDMKTLKMTAFGINFENAIGLAAGYDKNAEAVDGLFKMGFGFVEVGTVTPEPQEGNPKPRVFRLSDIKGIINRYGFNSDGYEAVYERLVRLSIPKERRGILGVNIGKNKDSQNHINDYVLGIKKFGHIADYIVINVSSPNTPGLRNLQHKGELVALTTAVLEAKNNLNIENKPSILLKLSPDLSYEDKKDIAKVILNSKTKVDGLIISNTTLSRPDISSCHINESGGLSGEPLKQLSLKTIKDMALLTKGEIPIIGVGGISSGRDALDCIKNGASLVQIYTVLTYDGPPVIRRIARELDDLLRDEGYSSISEAVGADLQIKKESWWRWW